MDTKSDFTLSIMEYAKDNCVAAEALALIAQYIANDAPGGSNVHRPLSALVPLLKAMHQKSVEYLEFLSQAPAQTDTEEMEEEPDLPYGIKELPEPVEPEEVPAPFVPTEVPAPAAEPEIIPEPSTEAEDTPDESDHDQTEPEPEPDEHHSH